MFLMKKNRGNKYEDTQQTRQLITTNILIKKQQYTQLTPIKPKINICLTAGSNAASIVIPHPLCLIEAL